ncbi:MAG: sialidase family protein [Candidatus Latescibacterota bacterium]
MAKSKRTEKALRVQHGVIASFPGDFFGYFGWPTVTLMPSGRLVVVASGFRNDSSCPVGRTVLCHSDDGGQKWTSPRVVNDSPLDDREAGIASLGEGQLLLSWFSSDPRDSTDGVQWPPADAEQRERWNAGYARMDSVPAADYAGAWMCLSEDGGARWGQPQRLILTAPHGPISLQTNSLLLLGKYVSSVESFARGDGAVASMRSTDGGRSWALGGTVPLIPNTVEAQYSDPHCVELPDGTLLGLICFQGSPDGSSSGGRVTDYSLVQTRSENRGRQWSMPKPLGFHGTPPHLIHHSSGAIICTYGHRQEPYGQRAMVSYDAGNSWEYDLVLRDDGFDPDLGYPASVELPDRSILTVYYQRVDGVRDPCSLLWTRWILPEKNE